MKSIKLLASFAISALITAGAFAENPKLTDPEIASVAVVANQIDISYAQIAKEKSKDKDVLNFAETMATDHAAVIKQASDLVKKLNVTPKDNDLSKQLMAN